MKRFRLIAFGTGLLLSMLLGFGIRAYTQTALPPSLPNSTTLFQTLLPALQATRFPYRLPTYIPANRSPQSNDVPPVQAVLNQSSDQGYLITLGYSPDCDGGNACRFGTVSGKIKPEASIEEENAYVRDWKGMRSEESMAQVQLASGKSGWFIPWTCGANCSDAQVVWDEYLYRYSVGVKVGEKAALVQMANSAIEANQR